MDIACPFDRLDRFPPWSRAGTPDAEAALTPMRRRGLRHLSACRGRGRLISLAGLADLFGDLPGPAAAIAAPDTERESHA